MSVHIVGADVWFWTVMVVWPSFLSGHRLDLIWGLWYESFRVEQHSEISYRAIAGFRPTSRYIEMTLRTAHLAATGYTVSTRVLMTCTPALIRASDENGLEIWEDFQFLVHLKSGENAQYMWLQMQACDSSATADYSVCTSRWSRRPQRHRPLRIFWNNPSLHWAQGMLGSRSRVIRPVLSRYGVYWCSTARLTA